jgi:two-component system NtrC family sensor kinase
MTSTDNPGGERGEAPVTEPRGRANRRALTRQAILVVEDEPEIAGLVAEVLHREGYDVDTAMNGEEALQLLQQRAYDAIVSDIRMPKVSGSGLYEAIAQWQPPLLRRLVFLTGDTLTPETQEFLRRTGAASLSKPFTLGQLLQAIQAVLGHNR